MIGIIGFGYVGQAVYNSIYNKEEVVIYDTNKNIGTMEDILKTDFVFVCVNTPENKDGSCNIDNVYDVLESLMFYKGIIILKSTILYEYIPIMKNLCYNPEFLNERTYLEDFKNQEYIILGGDINIADKVKKLYDGNFKGSHEYIFCTIKEAADFKYIRNVYNAYKVLFWEYVEDITGNSRKMGMMLDKLPISENTQVSMDGYRGYGGSCLPKDINAIHYKRHHKLTKFMKKFNKGLQTV